MKKIIMLTVAFFAIASLSSCSKEYECNCKVLDADGELTNELSKTVNGPKNAIEKLCNELDIEVGTGDFKVTTDCSVK